jgi:SAM-dependent methyltransferase
MEQTPIHDDYNPDLLAFLPPGMKRVVEVGSSSGALAKGYREANPGCEYVGIEIDPAYAEASQRYCSRVICGNIEQLDEQVFGELFPADCWIFGDSLEHLYDPWALLARIRGHINPDSRIVACVPNAQHWSLQASLNCGQFRYQPSGLLDRTHIRWFTRTTLVELFSGAGFRITAGMPRIFDEPQREQVMPAIRALAQAIGANPQQAADDATPMQWLVVAVPA